jgi:hypothetical protein
VRIQRRHKTRGQSLAEFALVFPVFLLILFGVFDIGRAVFAYNELTNSAREGVRLAIVNQDVPSVKARITRQSSAITVDSCVYFLEPSVTFPTCAKNGTAPAGGDVCPQPPKTVPSVGCVAHVEVWTDYRAITPIIGNLLGPMTFTANSELSVEFVCPNPGILSWSTAASCPKQE